MNESILDSLKETSDLIDDETDLVSYACAACDHHYGRVVNPRSKIAKVCKQLTEQIAAHWDDSPSCRAFEKERQEREKHRCKSCGHLPEETK